MKSKFIKFLNIRPTADQRRMFAEYECNFCGSLFESGYRKKRSPSSCGCQKHGETGTKLYIMWANMKSRCFNKKSEDYKYYGGRGIKVCDGWLNFVSFRNWANPNGYGDNLEIDRRNNDGNYEPSNCRFITHTENVRNRGYSKLSMEKAKKINEMYSTGKYSQRKLAEKFGVVHSTIGCVLRSETWS